MEMLPPRANVQGSPWEFTEKQPKYGFFHQIRHQRVFPRPRRGLQSIPKGRFGIEKCSQILDRVGIQGMRAETSATRVLY